MESGEWNVESVLMQSGKEWKERESVIERETVVLRLGLHEAEAQRNCVYKRGGFSEDTHTGGSVIVHPDTNSSRRELPRIGMNDAKASPCLGQRYAIFVVVAKWSKFLSCKAQA